MSGLKEISSLARRVSCASSVPVLSLFEGRDWSIPAISQVQLYNYLFKYFSVK
jgi:hypothetical protein